MVTHLFILELEGEVNRLSFLREFLEPKAGVVTFRLPKAGAVIFRSAAFTAPGTDQTETNH